MPGIQAAVFADPPKVDSNKEKSSEWQNHAVQHIEPKQGVGVDEMSAKHQKADFRTDKRHGRGYV